MARRGFESLEEMEEEDRRLTEESTAAVTLGDSSVEPSFDPSVDPLPIEDFASEVWDDLDFFGGIAVPAAGTSQGESVAPMCSHHGHNPSTLPSIPVPLVLSS